MGVDPFLSRTFGSAPAPTRAFTMRTCKSGPILLSVTRKRGSFPVSSPWSRLEPDTRHSWTRMITKSVGKGPLRAWSYAVSSKTPLLRESTPARIRSHRPRSTWWSFRDSTSRASSMTEINRWGKHLVKAGFFRSRPVWTSFSTVFWTSNSGKSKDLAGDN